MSTFNKNFRLGIACFSILLASVACDNEDVDTPMLDDYLGTYLVTEGGCTGVSPKSTAYNVTISRMPGENTKLEIHNLWDDQQNTVIADISGLSFTIPEQDFMQFSTQGKITGQGTFTSSGVQITKTFTGPNNSYTCTVTGPKTQ